MNSEKRVYVRELKEYFKLNQVTGNDESLNRWIITPDVNRPGLELSGYDKSNDLKRVILIGNKEFKYLEDLDYQTRKSRYQIITDSYTPCIIVTNGNKIDQALRDLATDRNFPVFETDEQTYRVNVNISAFLDDRLAPTDSFHGVLMNIFGVGVLFQGESGVGKSELALELIKKGHVLIADDRVEIKRIHNELYGEAHELLKNYLEIRGIGVIDVCLMFGASAVMDSTKISLVINLKRKNSMLEDDRLGINGILTKNIMSADVTSMELPVKEGRAMGAIVEAAVTYFRLSEQGHNSAEIFNQRVMDVMLSYRKGGK